MSRLHASNSHDGRQQGGAAPINRFARFVTIHMMSFVLRAAAQECIFVDMAVAVHEQCVGRVWRHVGGA